MPTPLAKGQENSFAPQMIFFGLRPGGWANNLKPFVDAPATKESTAHPRDAGASEMFLFVRMFLYKSFLCVSVFFVLALFLCVRMILYKLSFCISGCFCMNIVFVCPDDFV